jgi:hypothetical protein
MSLSGMSGVAPEGVGHSRSTENGSKDQSQRKTMQSELHNIESHNTKQPSQVIRRPRLPSQSLSRIPKEGAANQEGAEEKNSTTRACVANTQKGSYCADAIGNSHERLRRPARLNRKMSVLAPTKFPNATSPISMPLLLLHYCLGLASA